MQPIVVAVDFSNTSIHAIEYAIPLAVKMNAGIELIWVDKNNPSEAIYPDTTHQIRDEAKKRFDEIVKKYSKKLGKDLKMEYRLRKGKIYNEIDNLARSIGAACIIAGAHGISGFEEFWMGSNAFKIVSYASCPVITVRCDFAIGNGIRKILLPIDSTPETLQKIPFALMLARLFNSEVHVIATHSSHLKSIQRLAENYAQQAVRYLEKNKIKPYRDALVAGDITQAVLEYASRMEIDLISIMTEQETPANILLGPHAQQLVNQSPIPVLSTHPRENFCL
ncbi:MAG TPA: universal stress protein [Bacteroidales bacterium]|nr:universal stress protein [Bacteroidales bacterium]